MIALLLALGCSLAYGVGDFSGGLASRRANVPSVLAVSTPIGLVCLVALAAAVGADDVRTVDLALGAAAGVAGAAGFGLFYAGLARGRMQVVAPLSAVTSAVLPVTGGLLLGERPGLLAVPGTLVALVAVALVAGLGVPSAADARGSGAALGLASGLLFGLFFLLLDGVDGAAGLWPVVSSRAVATVLLVGVAVGLRAPLLRTRASLGLAVGAGVLDAAANALFLLAVDRGLLSVVAVVVSLYPAATVLLARVVLGERMSGLQMAGLGAAVVAVTLLAVA